MIKVEDVGLKLKVQMHCDTIVDILDELTAIIKSAKKLIAEAYDEQTAAELIAMSGKLAFADTEDVEEILALEIGRLLSEKGKQ